MTQPSPSQDFEVFYDTEDAFCDPVDGSFFHGFFGRKGGVSTGLYAGLNCGTGSDDDSAHVRQNKDIVAQQAGCESADIVTVHQVHGKVCVAVERPWAEGKTRPRADALATATPGLALGILTADCAPVLFAGSTDEGKPVIGAAHAGWGGALRGVLEATVETMEALGAERQSIKACIGPCIGAVSYEVQDDFARPFLEEKADNERFFKPARRESHLMFDLAGYCAAKLAGHGLKNVFIMDRDTYTQEGDFFSYRRATHRGEKDYGRQISLIMIRS